MKKGEDDTAVPRGKPPSSDSISAAHFSTASKEMMESCKKEEPMANGCLKGAKRRYPYSLLSAQAQDVWSIKLDQLEEKYSRIAEELSEDSDDAIEFNEDGIEDIVEKINRFEAKVQKWGKKRRYNANADENSNDDDEDDAPTSTAYLNLHNDEMTEKTN